MPAPPTSGSLIPLSGAVANSQDMIDIAALPNGTFVALWRDAANQDIYYRVMRGDGSQVRSGSITAASADGYQNSASLGVLPDGRFVMAYDDGTGITGRVAGLDGRLLGGPISIASAANPVVIPIGTSGDFAIAYDDSASLDVRGIGYGPDLSVVDGTIFYSAFGNATADSRSGAAVFADGAHAVAYLAGSALKMIYVSADFAFYETIEITVDGSVSAFIDLSPQLAVLADGNLLVAWTNTASAVQGRIYDRNGNPVTAAFEIAPAGYLSGLTALSGGGFMATFSNTSVTTSLGRIFGANYQPLDVAFTLLDGTGAASTEQRPVVTELADGRLVVAMLVFNGADFDTVAQVYDPRSAGLNKSASGFADDWQGTGFADRVYFGTGNDRYFAGGGNDTAYGEAGQDTLTGDAGGDKLYGGNDADTLSGGLDNDALNGDAGDDTLNGNEGSDTLNGGAGKDTLNGGSEGDILRGNDGDDTLNGDAGLDVLYGGNGNDTLNGGLDKDTLNGDANNDTLNAGEGGDTLKGGLGNDRMIGGLGGDVHLGGAGLDKFVFTFPNEGNDRVDDWVAVDDQIEIDASAFGGGLAPFVGSTLAADRLVLGSTPAATQPFGQFLYNTTTGQLSWDADGTGAAAAVAVTRLLNGGVAVGTLAVGDFDIVA